MTGSRNSSEGMFNTLGRGYPSRKKGCKAGRELSATKWVGGLMGALGVVIGMGISMASLCVTSTGGK